MVFHLNEGSRVVKPTTSPHQLFDILQISLLRVIPPPRFVVLLRRQQLCPDARSVVTPGAVVARIMAQTSGLPMADHVALDLGIVVYPLRQEAVLPHVAPEQHGVVPVHLSQHAHGAGHVELEETLLGGAEQLSQEGHVVQHAGVLGFEPEEAEDGPAEAKLDGLGVAVIQLEEEQHLPGGQLVGVGEEEDVVVSQSRHQWNALLAEIHPDVGVRVPPVALAPLGKL